MLAQLGRLADMTAAATVQAEMAQAMQGLAQTEMARSAARALVRLGVATMARVQA